MQRQELVIDHSKIGTRIAKRRKELKMTQETLTNFIDMSLTSCLISRTVIQCLQ